MNVHPLKNFDPLSSWDFIFISLIYKNQLVIGVIMIKDVEVWGGS